MTPVRDSQRFSVAHIQSKPDMCIPKWTVSEGYHTIATTASAAQKVFALGARRCSKSGWQARDTCTSPLGQCGVLASKRSSMTMSNVSTRRSAAPPTAPSYGRTSRRRRCSCAIHGYSCLVLVLLPYRTTVARSYAVFACRPSFPKLPYCSHMQVTLSPLGRVRAFGSLHAHQRWSSGGWRSHPSMSGPVT